jgi:rubrerythrin
MICEDHRRVGLVFKARADDEQLQRRELHEREDGPSSGPSHVSVWRCCACDLDVRVFSPLDQAIVGRVRTDCPSCGASMHRSLALRPNGAGRPVNGIVVRVPSAAWAA